MNYYFKATPFAALKDRSMRISHISRHVSAFLVLAMALLAPVRPAWAETIRGYLHDSTTYYYQARWMSAVSDDARLDEISMVGTHDSGATYGGDIAQTQTLGIRRQLEMGIRVLDMRCFHKNNSLLIYHGIIDQHQTAREFMDQVAKFLQDYPSETVLVRVKEENQGEGNTKSFAETFQDLVYAPLSAQRPGLFWEGNGALPRLRDVRGKIVLLYNFGHWYKGWDYAHAIDIQDQYAISNNWALYDKWLAVKAQMDKAYNQGPGHGLVMNYLSASGGSFPYFVASGKSSPGTEAPQLLTGKTTPGWNDWPDFPRISCVGAVCSIAFDGTNHLAWLHLFQCRGDCERKNGGKLGKMYLGILMADFPGPDLVDAVIRTNLLKDGRLPPGK